MIVPVVIENPMSLCLFSIISYWFCQVHSTLAKLLDYLLLIPQQSLLSLAYLSDLGPIFFPFLPREFQMSFP